MSLLPRLSDFGIGSRRVHEAELQQRVHALQSALDNCKGAAKHVATYQRSVLAVGAAALLAVGFTLGVYKDSIIGPAGGKIVATSRVPSGDHPAPWASAWLGRRIGRSRPPTASMMKLPRYGPSAPIAVS